VKSYNPGRHAAARLAGMMGAEGVSVNLTVLDERIARVGQSEERNAKQTRSLPAATQLPAPKTTVPSGLTPFNFTAPSAVEANVRFPKRL